MTESTAPPTIERERFERVTTPSKGVYPDPTTKLGQAWALAWQELRTAPDFLDGTELAARAAEPIGLSPNTMLGVFSRMANAGILAKERRPVVGTRGPRPRTFYRVP